MMRFQSESTSSQPPDPHSGFTFLSSHCDCRMFDMSTSLSYATHDACGVIVGSAPDAGMDAKGCVNGWPLRAWAERLGPWRIVGQRAQTIETTE